MPEFGDLLQRLLQSRYFTVAERDQIPKQQGAYVLWLRTPSPVCLKIGIAGPRHGEGLRGRIRFHFLSGKSSSVLARHLEADTDSEWAKDFDFADRTQRQQFLATGCYFQVLPLPQIGKEELRTFERYVQAELRPIYAGRVGKRLVDNNQ